MRESEFDITDDCGYIYEDLLQSGQDTPQHSLLFYHLFRKTCQHIHTRNETT